MKEKFKISDFQEVDLWTFRSESGIGNPIYYLQVRRLDKLTGNSGDDYNFRVPYENMENEFAEGLAREIDDRNFLHVISPPTDEIFPKKYRETIMATLGICSDLTHIMGRNPNIKAAHDKTKLDDLINSYYLKSVHPLDKIDSLLIVDDIFSEGKTAKAMLAFLQKCGLKKEAKIGIACALKIVPPQRPSIKESMGLFDQYL